ncbi:hypothetical protein [Micromonospora sp. WMMD1155]|uniref:hypothetical protein n=1 Tax=Micromonospora sp. WMMD1155 TaxID=3016094 RepID=UPI00249C29B8|nr:hypothetical protein [Micromonospora sp. WMMD1155]WFE51520.1 hypothetical protein O7617_14830 [Micromonospora sp. WMMD1155]
MRITEIRVHGVADKGPEAILDRPIVTRVAGDDNAGFYGPRPGYGAPADRGGVALEAYRWSRLTGGTATRTFSLVLLLPFMLSNIAVWMLPVTGCSGRAARALCRLLAATMTAMYVLSTVGVSLDLIAWQCAAYPRCMEGRREISWLGDVPPGQRLALLAVPPIIAIVLIWRLGARTWQLPEDSDHAPGVGADRLDAPAFWDTRSLLRRLRSVHVAVALGTLDLALLLALAPHDATVPGWLLLAADVALLAGAVVLLCRPTIERRGETDQRSSRTIRWAAVALTALTLAYALLPRPPWKAEGMLPGYGMLVAGLFAGQVALLAILGLVVVVQRRSLPRPLFLLAGLGAPVLITVAIGLGVAYDSGLTYGLAEYLDRGSSPTPARPLPPGAPPLSPPIAFRWVTLGFTLATLLVLVTALLIPRIGRDRRRREAEGLVRRDYPEASRAAPERVRAVRDAIVRARLTDRLGPLLATAYVVLALLTLAAAGLSVIGPGPGALAFRLGGEPLARPVIFVTDLGALLIGLFAIVLAVLGLVAYRSGAIRLVGVLWELATFWPRAVHPLAPPCYVERAVPELSRRIGQLTADGNAVLLSGQSHGSVLAAATVLQLPDDCRRRVALLTYGAPLGNHYRRVFPAYVSDEMLREVGDRLAWRWINLWRYTDAVGGAVFAPFVNGADDPAARVDRRVRDPKGLLIPPTDTVPPPVQGHRFTPDDDFHAAIRDLVGRLKRTDG